MIVSDTASPNGRRFGVSLLAERTAGRVRRDGHGFALLDKIHLCALRLEPFHIAGQRLFRAAHADGLQILTIRQVPQAILVARPGSGGQPGSVDAMELP
jgi:hypothetical protein